MNSFFCVYSQAVNILFEGQLWRLRIR